MFGTQLVLPVYRVGIHFLGTLDEPLTDLFARCFQALLYVTQTKASLARDTESPARSQGKDRKQMLSTRARFLSFVDNHMGCPNMGARQRQATPRTIHRGSPPVGIIVVTKLRYDYEEIHKRRTQSRSFRDSQSHNQAIRENSIRQAIHDYSNTYR